MFIRRSVAAFYGLLFVALTLFAGLFFLRTYGEYEALRMRRADSEMRLADLERRVVDERRTLERLRTDPAFVEREIRARLLFAGPAETVFRFER
jgi:cell division protein FtsB